MGPLSDDRRRYMLHQRLALRWMREGGVVVARGGVRKGERSTYEFSEAVMAGPALQLTCNLREVGKACRSLNHYVVYLWNCDRESEYVLCGLSNEGAPAFEPLYDARTTKPSCRVSAACYAGRFPHLRLDVYDAQSATPFVPGAGIKTRILLPRGLCAIIYQGPPQDLLPAAPNQTTTRSFTARTSGGVASLKTPVSSCDSATA